MWSFFDTANWFALAILAVLVIMSALSWAIIVAKVFQFRHVQAENESFLAALAKDAALSSLYSAAQELDNSTLARMYEQVYREISAFKARMDKAPVPDARARLLDSMSRTLERAYNQQVQGLEYRLPLLATLSSSAPYVGLFGTVLGIIDAFRNIGSTGVTSLAVVAPGISESLVATAGGLLAAIPALVAYNYYRNRIRDITSQMKNFALELINRFDRIL